MNVLQTADRALEVVRLVASRGQVTVTAIAGALDISVSMAHRLLSTCTKAGFIRQDVSGGSYAVGPVLRQVASDVVRDSDLEELLGPLLRRTAKDLLETCSLAVLEGRNIRFLMSVEGSHLVKISRPIRTVTPAQTTAAGRALLSTLDKESVRARYREARWEPTSVSDIRTLDDLVVELEKTRDRGWAVQAGQAQPGLAAVAMPVIDGMGRAVVAVTVTVPYVRLHRPSDARELAARLRPHVDLMERRLLG